MAGEKMAARYAKARQEGANPEKMAMSDVATRRARRKAYLEDVNKVRPPAGRRVENSGLLLGWQAGLGWVEGGTGKQAKAHSLLGFIVSMVLSGMLRLHKSSKSDSGCRNFREDFNWIPTLSASSGK